MSDRWDAGYRKLVFADQPFSAAANFSRRVNRWPDDTSTEMNGAEGHTQAGMASVRGFGVSIRGKAMKEGFVIESQNLSKRYGNVEAVNGITFGVEGGRITGFLGRNGAGKSTTIKMLLGMIKPTSGTGTVLSYRIDDRKESVLLRRKVAHVGEDKGLYPYMTVQQIIRFTRSFYEDWRPEIEGRLLKHYELPPDRKVKSLSKGMRTKLALLLALSRRPALLILDEPTEGLDPVSVEELLEALRGIASDDTAIFFSSHQLHDVERIADYIIMIDHGKLVMDVSFDQLRQNYRRIVLEFGGQPPVEKFKIPGVERIHTNGSHLTLLTSCNPDAIVERARDLAALSFEVTPLSLREIFLDKVKENL
jgi:ABC-2 type transport system ATP-binding protein